MKEIIDNKSKFFKKNIVAICITEKILNNQVKSKVLSMFGYNKKEERMSVSIPFIEGMKTDYLLDVYHFFSKKEDINFLLDSSLKESLIQKNTEKPDYFKVCIITKDKVKDIAVNTCKYYADVLDFNISITSLFPIKHNFEKCLKNINSDNKIKKISSNVIDEYLNISEIAYT
ncbi:hypothetical protein [Candidatus Enterococcus ikei]|uniref:Uncharacterized protein n=1 Tax=Candidatus Enterococcus ikei TaxID=2815326 RepID=A0ABS3GWQ8_9ENTE|nr:hypothetical protein [Enterococcus sp. DIV0869a]MBO0439394.1 hypothetical protein [Enterococcus sp. DIV0869a]